MYWRARPSRRPSQPIGRVRAGARQPSPPSEVRSDAFDFPVPVTDGIQPVAALKFLRRVWGPARGAPGGGLGKRAFAAAGMGFLRPEVGVSVGFVLFMQLSMLG